MVHDIDYEELTTQLIKTLRGTQSQRTLSRRLGYKSNVVYHWESGRRSPTTLQMFEVLELVSPEKFQRSSVARIREPRQLGKYMDDLAPAFHHSDVGDIVDRSTQTIRRWLSGESQPRFPEFLEFLEITRRASLDWISEFIDPLELEATRESWDRLLQIRTIGTTMPISMTVINAVELAAYRALPEHEPGWIGRRVGLDASEERYVIESLAEVGLLVWDDTHWRVNVAFISLVRSSLHHWVQTCLDGPFDKRFFVSAVSSRTLERVREATREYWSEIGEILAEDEDPDRIIAMTLLAARVDVEDD